MPRVRGNIRLATKDDTAAILALLDLTGLRLGGVDYDEFEHTLVSIHQDRIVGACRFLAAKPSGFIDFLVVHPDYQKRGVALTLMATAEFLMAAQGVKWYVGYSEESLTTHHQIFQRAHGHILSRGLLFLKRVLSNGIEDDRHD